MVLLGVFRGLYDIIKIDDSDKPVTDTKVFQLHYKWTRLLLFVFCIIVSLNSLVGKPIACTGAQGRLQDVMQSYCWITGTFTYEKYFGNRNRLGDDKLSMIGIGPGREDKDAKQHITYYQWVPIVLFLQGILFYVPHWIWKMFEDHRIRQLMEGMVETKLEEKKRHKRQSMVVQYLVESKGSNEWYAYQYIACEILNFVNVILNIALVDKFLGGDFFSFGIKLIEYDPEDPSAVDPSHYTFPKQTKCTFRYFGSSGTVQRIDSICILPVNIFNEKLYAILWFWFVALAAITGVNILWRVAMLMSPILRVWLLQNKGHVRDVGNMSVVTSVVNNITFSDYFFVWLFTKNLSGMVLFDFLREYSKAIAVDMPPKKLEHMYPTLPRDTLQLRERKVQPNGRPKSTTEESDTEQDVKKPLTPYLEMDDPLYARMINKRKP